MTTHIPKSALEAKHLLLPGLCERYAGVDFDVYVRDDRDVMLKDASGEHLLISEPELKDGWAKVCVERMDAARTKPE